MLGVRVLILIHRRADVIGAFIAMVTGILLLYRLSVGNMDAGLAGLALSWALQFVPQVNWLVRNYTQGNYFKKE
jgi:hypothetical protein